MDYTKIDSGKTPPTDVNAIIEIAKNEGRVKYEFDRASGAIFVDRVRETSMLYPINYGCIPQTISEDGDPLDILVLCADPIQTGTVIPVRPVGVLLMDDEKGHDVKIIAVPADRVSPDFGHIQDVGDIPASEKKKIEHFFKHYKDLDGAAGRWSTVAGWKDVKEAHRYITEAIDRASPTPAGPAPKGPKTP